MPALRRFASCSFLPLLSIAACRASAPPEPAFPGGHPASPDVAVAEIADPGAGLRGAPAMASPPAVAAATPLPPAPPTTEEPAISPAAYLCPMHLEVGSDEPGRCPKCKMKLVPRAQALEHAHGD